MATEYLSMDDARALVRTELEKFVTCRACGFDSVQAAYAIGVTPATGVDYERILRHLLQLAANTVTPSDALAAIRDRTQQTAPEAPGAEEDAPLRGDAS